MTFASPTTPSPHRGASRQQSSPWPSETERFADRVAAGRTLAAVIADLLAPPAGQRPLVLGVPRGGVLVAGEVARVLGADLDTLAAAPIVLPWRPRTAVGAIAGTGPAIFDHDALATVGSTAAAAAPVVRHARAGLLDRQRQYRGGRQPAVLAGRTVVVTDDGLSPAIVTRAVVRAARAAGPARVVFAAPVCAAESADLLGAETDAVVHLHCPRVFPALGLWYRTVTPVTDQDVTRVLTQNWGAIAATPVG